MIARHFGVLMQGHPGLEYRLGIIAFGFGIALGPLVAGYRYATFVGLTAMAVTWIVCDVVLKRTYSAIVIHAVSLATVLGIWAASDWIVDFLRQ